MIQKVVKILLILVVTAFICGIAGAVSIGAETHETSGVEAPVCTAPCECISESAAIAQWGLNGYELCSKTICGQSADASVQYHCIHPVGSMTSVPTTAPAQVVPVSSAAIPAASPSAAGTTQKSPVGIATLLAALGAALLAGAGTRRK